MLKNHDLKQEEVGEVEDLMHVMRSAANEQSVLVRVYSIGRTVRAISYLGRKLRVSPIDRFGEYL